MKNHKKYSERQKLNAIKEWEDNYDFKYGYKEDYISILAHKYKCCNLTLKRWKKKYLNGMSLQNIKPIPKTPHPNAHTKQETQQIQQQLLEPYKSLTYKWGILRESGYTRTYEGFMNYIHKHLLIPQLDHIMQKALCKPYNTPLMLGAKIQVDVKYVPSECYDGELLPDCTKPKFYQYSAIDEADRVAFAKIYTEHTMASTQDFIHRLVRHFGYIPRIIQTDNGKEFKGITIAQIQEQRLNLDQEHKAEQAMRELEIFHKLIRPATPRWNGKVERFHRSCQEFFYNGLRFNNIQELQHKLTGFLLRYNNTPHHALVNRYGKKAKQTPLQKQTELLQLYKEQQLIKDNTITITYYKIINEQYKLTTETMTLEAIRFLQDQTTFQLMTG